MIGIEQTVVPLIGKNEFGIESNTIIVSFIASFGLVKAFLNLFAGKGNKKCINNGLALRISCSVHFALST